MAVIDNVLFALCMAVALAIMASVGYLVGRSNRQPTRIVPVARKVDNRVVSGYTRAERRAYKRRQRV